MKQIEISNLRINKLFKKRLADAGITTVDQLLDGWDSVVPEILGFYHRRIKSQIEIDLKKLGYDVVSTTTYRLKRRT